MNDRPHDAPESYPPSDPNAHPDAPVLDPHTEQPGAAAWPGLAVAYAAWPTDQDARVRFIPPPEQHLDPKAQRLWIFGNLILVAVPVAIAIGVVIALHRWRDLAMVWTIAIPAILAVVGGLLAWTQAVVSYRTWRYAIRADEVDLQHGLFTKRRQLVPMARIQHVDTRQGPLERRYGLATVLFFTAAGGMEIPALSVEHAAEVRNQIAALAKVHDDL